MTSGRIEKLGSNEVNLIWHRLEATKNWTNAPQPKVQLFMKLITAKSNEEVANGFVKFKGN